MLTINNLVKIGFTVLLRWLAVLMVGALAGCTAARLDGNATTQATTVYLVRHAEKDLTPNLADPPLAPAGEQRALALRDKLQSQHIAAIFTTDTRRTRATVAPLAEALKLTPQVYDAKQLPALAAKIKRDYGGKVVLVVGHSNTVLETAEALGAVRPVPAIKDADYSYLFEVDLASGQAPVASVQRYGEPQ